MSIKSRIPWYIKIPVKIVLSRLPVPHAVWRRFDLFRHGQMNEAEYALDVFSRHYSWFRPSDYPQGFTMLELGPGDSIATGLMAAGYGASRCYLVDHDSYVIRNLPAYRSILDGLERRGVNVGELKAASNFEELCVQSRTTYLTEGLTSLKGIPGASVDFIFSNAVLEHVRKHEFQAVIRETRRILRPGGLCSHEVDLRDHLAEGLNHLRFGHRLWESSLMANSGFYTNRIRYQEMLAAFHEAGFSVRVVDTKRWDSLPTPRRRLAKPFRSLDEDELRVSSFHVLLT